MKTSALSRALLSASLLATLAAAAGCVVSIDGDHDHTDGAARYYKASPARMDALVAASRNLHLGMTAAEALALYPEEHATLKSSAYLGDAVVEEWRVLALDTRRDILFRRWLYFADGRLVEFSSDRRSLRRLTELPPNWR